MLFPSWADARVALPGLVYPLTNRTAGKFITLRREDGFTVFARVELGERPRAALRSS